MRDPSSADEEDLIRRFRSGDPEAFRVLADAGAPRVQERLEPRLPRWLARRVSVSDLVQEACVSAFRHRRDFAGSDVRSFRRWLFGMARLNARRAVQHHGEKAMRAVDREVTRGHRPSTMEFAGAATSPSEAAIAGETSRCLERALAEMMPDQREILRLARDERLPLRVVAERMGRSYAAVKKMHGRALARLTELFAGLGGDDGGRREDRGDPR